VSILNLKYTSRYGDNLRSIARQAALLPTPPAQATTTPTPDSLPQFQNPSNLRRLFSLKHEFPTEWYKFLNPADIATSQSMQIGLGNERFPFQYRQKTIQYSEVELFLVFKSAQFQADYSGGSGSTGTGNQQLKLHLGPPAISNSPSAILTSSLSFLGGLAYGYIAQPPQPATSGGSPPVWFLSVDSTDIAGINSNLRNLGSTGEAHLNPAAINDVLMLCHYSVSS
jgi:hypothetical protein